MLLGVNVRHAEEQLRGTLALPHGLGKDVTDRRLRPGPAGPRRRGRRSRLRRRRRPRQESRGGGLDRLRRGDRHPADDGHGRQARPRARPAGQDAQPEGRHGHRRHREGGHRVQGGQGRVPHRPPGDRPHGDRQGQPRRRQTARQLHRGDGGDRPRQALRGEGPLHRLLHADDDDGPRNPGRRLQGRRPRRR